MTRSASGGSAVAERPRDHTPVDPRLRARRIEVRRREGRRRLRRLVFALVVTAVCAAAWGVTRSPLLDVDHIEVHGVSRLGGAEVVAAAGIDPGDPLVDLDLDAARDAIEALSWVEVVEVDRSWWGTVRYTVTERIPAVVLLDESRAGAGVIADIDGWVLAAATPADRGALTHIEGVDAADPGSRLEPAHRAAVELGAGITVGLEPWVDAIVVDPDGEHWLRLDATAPVDAPARVRLGTDLDLPAQVVAAETVLTHVDLTCLATIDVRVASAPVVTRLPDCELS